MTRFEWNMANRLEVLELKKGGSVGIPGKKQKKFQKFIVNSNERFNVLFLELTIQWFLVLCAAIAWDKICDAFLIHHKPGIGPVQWVVAVFATWQVVRYARMVKR